MATDPLKAPADAGADESSTSEAAPRTATAAQDTSPPGDANGAGEPSADLAQELPEQPEQTEQPERPELPTEPAQAYALAGEELEALTAKAEKADEYLLLAQRTQADFENYRKRAARDAAIAKERGATRLARELLPAVDNLERALEHAPTQSDPTHPDGAFVSGIRHVHSDVVAALQRAGIERYSPEGEPFDPTLHEAVAQQPVEGAEPGTVVEVFQSGYRMGDSVVRPARVVVAG
jgi:molecular chaperone GrpE